MSWGECDIPAATRFWAQVRLLAGGRFDSLQSNCRKAATHLCMTSGGGMPCGCHAWLNFTERQRRMLIAAEAGMPVSLIAFLADDQAPKHVERQLAAMQAIASLEPLRSHLERLVTRIPAWSAPCEPVEQERAKSAGSL